VVHSEASISEREDGVLPSAFVGLRFAPIRPQGISRGADLRGRVIWSFSIVSVARAHW